MINLSDGEWKIMNRLWESGGICFIERAVEQDVMDFCLGNSSSYMEADIREATDKAGFCRMHFKKMFDYGNTLGNAWILKTHYQKTLREMKQQFASFSPGRVSLKDKLKGNTGGNGISMWVAQKNASCYICDHFKDNYSRYTGLGDSSSQ